MHGSKLNQGQRKWVYVMYLTTRTRLVTTGETGTPERRRHPGSSISAPACIFREKEAQQPTVRPLGGPFKQAVSGAYSTTTAQDTIPTE